MKKTKQIDHKIYLSRVSERGNVFTILLAAVALTAVLGTQIFSTLSGPVASLSRVTNKTIADKQMLAASKIVIMDAANLAASGDCDADGAIEPREWRTGAGPTGGGLIPTTIGAPVTDPWGTDYGYCVWDTGALRNNAGCGGAGQNRLEGSPNPSAGNTDTQFVIALVSAGPNRQFNTSCADYVDTTTPILTQGGDDVVYRYTYAEASVATSSLWYLQDGDPSTAEIQKDLQIGDDISVDAGAGLINALGANITGRMVAGGGVAVGDETNVVDAECSASTAGLIRYNAVSVALEVCDGTGASGWQAAGAAGGVASSILSTGACNVAADAGKVRYNNSLQRPEFCDGNGWSPFVRETPVAYIAFDRLTDTIFTVSGPCSGGGCPFAFSGWRTFTVLNLGNVATAVLSTPTLTGTNAANFELDLAASTCDNGIALQAAEELGNSCTIVVRARASANGTFSARLNVTDGTLTDSIPLRMTSKGFGCVAGALTGGGILTDFPGFGCSSSNPTTGSVVLQPAGCGCGTSSPTCTGDPADDCWLSPSAIGVSDTISNNADPAQYTMNATGYVMGHRPADYCRSLTLNGHSDWFLPSRAHAEHIRTDLLATTAFAPVDSYAIAETGNINNDIVNQGVLGMQMIPGGSLSRFFSTATRVRCVRRHNVPRPAAQTDTNPEYSQGYPKNSSSYFFNPDLITFNMSTGRYLRVYANTVSTVVTSEPIIVRGLSTPTGFTVSGSGSPEVSINGGSFASSGTIPIAANTNIRIRITTPSSTGTMHRGFVQIGTDEQPIVVEAFTTNPTITRRVFVTSMTYNVAGTPPSGFRSRIDADTLCVNRATAASLSGASTYRALLGVNWVEPVSSLNHFTHRFETVGGTLIANNFADFVDGNIPNAITNESNASVTGTIWTGAQILERSVNSSFWNCGGWGDNQEISNGAQMPAAQTTGFGSGTAAACNVARRLLCIGPN